MTEMHASYGANHTGKMGLPDPDAVMWRILTEHPEYRKQMGKAHEALIAEADDDPELRRAMLMSEATRSFWRVNLKMDAPPPGSPAEAEAAFRDRVEKKRKQDKEARDKVIQTLSAFVSRIAEMTFGEVGKMAKKSKQLAKLAKMGKPFEIVGEKLTGQQITKIISAR